MSNRRPTYKNNHIGAWIEEVPLTPAQADLLKSICDKQEFSLGVQRIASMFVAISHTHEQLSSAAEDAATMADLEISVAALKFKLDNLPARLDAYLYKFHADDKMKNLKSLLAGLSIDISRAAPGMTKPTPKPPTNGAAIQAAALLKALFNEYELTFTPKKPTYKTWAAGECMKIILASDPSRQSNGAISGYIRDAKY